MVAATSAHVTVCAATWQTHAEKGGRRYEDLTSPDQAAKILDAHRRIGAQGLQHRLVQLGFSGGIIISLVIVGPLPETLRQLQLQVGLVAAPQVSSPWQA